MGDFKFSMKVFGVGGAGINALNDMIESGVEGVEYIAADTNVGKLNTSLSPVKIQLGSKITFGLGTGGDYHKGYLCAKEEDSTIKELLKDTDMLFIVSGMGGGTGSGAVLRIAELAHKLDILTVAIVTKPFSFEGRMKKLTAQDTLEHLKPYVDSYIIISNDNLLMLPNANITLQNAFKEADKILKNSVKNIKDIIFKNGLINLDFADIKAVLKNAGEAMIGFGRGKGGIAPILEAALTSPLIEGEIKGAQQLLINIASGDNLPLDKLAEVQMAINKLLIIEPENIILGVIIDEELESDIEIAVIGTKIKSL
ncbi:cell division protein FtsZ [uncultured Ilyobacter sp.]|uniref:cell division protein FtsZ n=1 Tax=uncultured Ilyobacter sp. TaxID=544433 RepID=UPI0029BFC5C4|nr:cell division protein FtsZ [uncultured Ilyobacter sp.]